MLLTDKVEIKITKANINHYQSKGYNVNLKDVIMVNAIDLTKGSHFKVDVQCDFCNKKLNMEFKSFLAQRNKSEDEIDVCNKCGYKKAELNNIRKYGVKNTMHLDSTKEKLKNTMLDRYGVENYSQTNEYKDKIKSTCLSKYGVTHYSSTEDFKIKYKTTIQEKYGVDYYTQTDEYKQKAKATNLECYGVANPMQNETVRLKGVSTNLERYGVENPFQSEVIKDKIKITNLNRYGSEHISRSEYFKNFIKGQWEEWKENGKIDDIIAKRVETNIEKYGYPVAMQNPEISKKAFTTMYKNKTAPSSKQQIHINNLVNGELNYPFGRCVLDISFLEEKIYLEYDGGGHDLSVLMGNVTSEQFNEKEKRRTYFMLNNGWKEIRIITSTDKLPKDELIVDFVDRAKSFLMLENYVSVKWNLETNKVIVNFKREYDLDYFLHNCLEEVM